MKRGLLALGLLLGLLGAVFAGCQPAGEPVNLQTEPLGETKSPLPGEPYGASVNIRMVPIGETEYPLLTGNYVGDYSLQQVCFVEQGFRDPTQRNPVMIETEDFFNPPEDFNQTAVMDLEAYTAYCEKWGLTPAYEDPETPYLVIAYASPGAGRLEFNLAEVTAQGDTATVWLRDILRGVLPQSLGYVLTVPAEAGVTKVETRRVYTREELDNLKQYGSIYNPRETAAPEKPVICLYPEHTTRVRVRLDYDGVLTCSYPSYAGGWEVTAAPDGTLTDQRGRQYDSLFWEGRDEAVYDFSEGFCVAGADTAAFLEDALAKLGLTEREANAFLVYWLPRMEDNAWNLISFQGSAYTDTARLEIQPAPDTLLRVFMAWKPLEMPVEVEPQVLEAPARRGFTVVEWGGAELP